MTAGVSHLEPAPPARLPPTHRGVHDRGERRRRPPALPGAGSRSCTGCIRRRTRRGSESSARSSAGPGSTSTRARSCGRPRLRRRRSRPPGAPDTEILHLMSPPGDGEGGLPTGQHRPLRARARALHALHLPDPPLSGPAGAPGAAGRRGRLHARGDGGPSGRAPRRRSAGRRRHLATPCLDSSASTCVPAWGIRLPAGSPASSRSGCSSGSTASRWTAWSMSGPSAETGTGSTGPAGFLEGEATGRRFAVGDEMEVRITGADPDERRIHLEPVALDGTPAGGEDGPRRGGRRGRGRGPGRIRGRGRGRRF